MKARFIFNPRSGRNARNPILLERAHAFIREYGLDANVALTERPKHATELARQAVAEGCNLVVAIGGDGTLNEVATGLIGGGAALGLIPCGTGNGLGRHLGIPRAGQGAFKTLIQGRVRSIDTGSANGLPFFNVMGVGFDAEISARFNQLVRRGLVAYSRTTCGALFGYRSEEVAVRTERGRIQTPAFLLTVSNSDQYGNDCYIAPGAQVDDGQLDLTILTHVNLFTAFPLAARLFLKTIDRSHSVIHQRGAHFIIERAKSGLIHTDGEIHQTSAVINVAIHPRSLKVMVPSGPESS